jgi:molecular chaperone Hsp33
LTGGALMGALLKTGQRLALKFEGDGPLGKILVEADSDGGVRGYVRAPNIDLPLKEGKLDVSGALGGNGLLTVVKDLKLKDPYKSIVKLRTGEIAEDLAFYFAESEQIPSAVGLGVYVNGKGTVSSAGGFLVQSFPPYDETAVDAIIQRIRQIPPITELIRQGRKPEHFMDILFEGIPFDVLETRELLLRCSCSRERVEQALFVLGRAEMMNLAEEQGEVDVTCEFCHKRFRLTKHELERLATVQA